MDVSYAFEQHGDALAAADAHGRQCITALDAVQFVNGLGRDDRTGGAHRMAERDARTVGVDLLRVEAQFLRYGTGLRGEGLVRLDDSWSGTCQRCGLA